MAAKQKTKTDELNDMCVTQSELQEFMKDFMKNITDTLNQNNNRPRHNSRG